MSPRHNDGTASGVSSSNNVLNRKNSGSESSISSFVTSSSNVSTTSSNREQKQQNEQQNENEQQNNTHQQEQEQEDQGHLKIKTTTRLLSNISKDYGILIYVDTSGTCKLRYVKDYNCDCNVMNHPNIYVPDNITNLKKLGGGGSGVTVFQGEYVDDNDDVDNNNDNNDDNVNININNKNKTNINNIVMKHGGFKETKELYAHVEIMNELNKRNMSHQNNSLMGYGGTSILRFSSLASVHHCNDSPADNIKQRIPEFKMLYISPNHFREKGIELWSKLKHILYRLNSYVRESPKEYRQDKWLSILQTSTSEEEEDDNDDNDDNDNNDNNNNDNEENDNNNNEDYDDSSCRRHRRRHQEKKKPSLPLLRNSKIIRTKSTKKHIQLATKEAQDIENSRHSDRIGTTLTKTGKPICIYADDELDETCNDVKIQINDEHCNIYVGKYSYGSTVTSTVTSTSTSNDDDNDDNNNNNNEIRFGNCGLGYDALSSLINDTIIPLQRKGLYKFTQGQKTIGGRTPITPSQLLVQGKLHGKLLNRLIKEFIIVVKNLQKLTLKQEINVIEHLKYELKQIEDNDNNNDNENNNNYYYKPENVSGLFDTFVGMSIRKNYSTKSGRFIRLRNMGLQFRNYFLLYNNNNNNNKNNISSSKSSSSTTTTTTTTTKSLILTNEEIIPIYYLSIALQSHKKMNDIFENNNGLDLDGETMLDFVTYNFNYGWKGLLRRSIYGVNNNKTALSRIWSCGLTDAGIHNLFLSTDGIDDDDENNENENNEEENTNSNNNNDNDNNDVKLWLFDLGPPTVQSTPGFLTKFLFSFFHTLGMEEQKDVGGSSSSGGNKWVCRFKNVTTPISNYLNINNNNDDDDDDDDNSKKKNIIEKLVLTNDTKIKLNNAYNAFEITFNEIIKEIFDNEDAVRPLLIQYVTLQLLSDASFCLERWEIKGGGQSRESNHQTNIEEWLWRALWDIYVVFDINTKRSLERFKVSYEL